MGPLVVIIALELVFTGGIVGLSSHKLPNVLGIHKIAQVDDNTTAAPADTSNVSAPADSSSDTSQPANDSSSTNTTNTHDTTSNTPSSESNPATSPSDQNSTINQSGTEQPSPSEGPGLFEQEMNPSPSPQEGSSPNPQSSGEPSPSPNSVETNVSQTQAVLSPGDLINSPENINDQSVSEAKKEEDQISQTTNPIEQTNLLINFATDKVKDMNNFTKSDDFASTIFAASRFNEQVDQALGNLEKLSPKDQVKLKKQLVNFCNQADRILRTVQLSVPEESEQDLLIARGQCQELQL